MKVLLVGNLAEDRQESMRRFTTLLAEGLRGRGHQVDECSPVLTAGRLARPYRYSGYAKYLGYIDKLVLFPIHLRREVRRLRPDVVHITDHSNAAYASAASAVPVVGTVHDLLQIRAARGDFPQQPVGRMGRRQQAGILAAIGRLPWAACVSNATRSDLLSLTDFRADRAVLIPNALNHPYRRQSHATVAERLASLPLGGTLQNPAGYILHVGGAQWYKNRNGVLRIYAALRKRLAGPLPDLVMVGPPLDETDLASVQQLEIAPFLRMIVGVTNAQLEAFYSGAQGLLFPSWIEGFGWPIAEAQATGCPVFTSRGEPMQEVGGKSAVYFDPSDPVSAAETIAKAWPSRAELSTLGLAEAARWSPDVMLAAYETLYSKAVAA